MKAEIIAVGTEVLMGEVINSNAAWLSQELAQLGIDVYHHVTVGDNPGRIHKVIDQALARADVLIFTGGLGPTEDDLTMATLAEHFNRDMVMDPDSEQRIRAFFLSRNTPMSANNIKQALRPADALTLTNPIGTAPGVMWQVDNPHTGQPAFILTFPGVPRELYAMWPEARDFLQQQQRAQGEAVSILRTSFLHFFGIGESKLAEMLNDLMKQASPSVAPYVGRAEVKIRIAAKAPTADEADAQIAAMKQTVIQRCEQYYFGQDGETLESVVGKLLLEKGWHLAVAESCTGGLVSSRLTDVPGSSGYITLNMVTYANEAKASILGVSEAVLAEHGAVSPQVALAMAEGILARVESADFGLSLTGIAGPGGGSDEKPVGLVYVALCSRLDGFQPIVKKVLMNRNFARTDIKYWFSQYALYFLRLYLLGRLSPDAEE